MRWNGVWPGGGGGGGVAVSVREGRDAMGSIMLKHDDDGGATGRSEGRELEGTADGSGSTTMRITKGGPLPLKHEAGENRGQGKGGNERNRSERGSSQGGAEYLKGRPSSSTVRRDGSPSQQRTGSAAAGQQAEET